MAKCRNCKWCEFYNHKYWCEAPVPIYLDIAYNEVDPDIKHECEAFDDD